MATLPIEPVFPGPARPRRRAAVDGITAALFACVLCAPFVDERIRPDDARSPRRENREARKMPGLPRKPSEWYAFPSAFEAHHSDTFGLRDVLLRWNSLEKIHVFGVAPTPNLVLGPGEWIDYAGERTMEILRGVEPMTTDELEAWTEYFELCRAICARADARYYFLVCPNKETIYPEMVPARFERLGPTRLEQLMAWLPPDLRECIVDPRADLRSARAQDVPPDDHLYNVSGTHWNGRGSWIAYQSVVRALQASWPDVRAIPDDGVVFPKDPFPSPDSWRNTLYLRDDFAQPSRPLRLRDPLRHEVLETVSGSAPRWRAREPGQRGPRTLVFHDSFGPQLAVPMAETLPEVLFVQTWFDPLLVLVEQPGAVVEVRVERVLATLPFMPVARGMLDDWSSVPPEEGRLLVSLDASSPDAELSTEGPARVEQRGDELEFTSELNLGGWILPKFVLEEGERAWLHVELESDARGLLVAYRRSNDTGDWMRRDTAWLRYGPGRHSRTIALPGPSGPREIRLHHFRAPASVRIRLLEVRATRS